jgi:hypothetical protein
MVASGCTHEFEKQKTISLNSRVDLLEMLVSTLSYKCIASRSRSAEDAFGDSRRLILPNLHLETHRPSISITSKIRELLADFDGEQRLVKRERSFRSFYAEPHPPFCDVTRLGEAQTRFSLGYGSYFFRVSQDLHCHPFQFNHTTEIILFDKFGSSFTSKSLSGE